MPRCRRCKELTKKTYRKKGYKKTVGFCWKCHQEMPEKKSKNNPRNIFVTEGMINSLHFLVGEKVRNKDCVTIEEWGDLVNESRQLENN